MTVTFSEGHKHRFACYRLTYEECKAPDRIAKIKADLASKGRVGYTIAITCDSSPILPSWSDFIDALLHLEERCEMWKLLQDDRQRKRTVEERKEVNRMSTSYFIFTEIQVDDIWHCINPKVTRLLPIEHLIIVPTLRTDARIQFEKAYRQLDHDGQPFAVDEMSKPSSIRDRLARPREQH